MTNGKSVPDPKRVYLDSNVFIYALEGGPDFAEPAQLLISRSRASGWTAITSELTLAEVLVRPERLGQFNLKRDYLNLLIHSSAIQLVPVSQGILKESAAYRARVYPDKPGPEEDKRNFLPDAIHVVTAIEAEATFFVARDVRLRLPDWMTRVVPDQAGITELLRRLS